MRNHQITKRRWTLHAKSAGDKKKVKQERMDN